MPVNNKINTTFLSLCGQCVFLNSRFKAQKIAHCVLIAPPDAVVIWICNPACTLYFWSFTPYMVVFDAFKH